MAAAGPGAKAARQRAPDSSLLRRARIRGAPRQPRQPRVRRVPRSLGGAVLGLLVMGYFFFRLSGNSLSFLLMLLAAFGLLAFSIWVLIQLPLRPRFDQRWRPKRRIAPLDRSGWAMLANEIDGKLALGRQPRIDGTLEGLRYRLTYHQKGGARTVAEVMLPAKVKAGLTLFPRRAVFSTPHSIRVGDAEFDRAWHVICAEPGLARAMLSTETRKWLAIAEPEEVRADRRAISARLAGYVPEADRLWALVMVAVLIARGASRPPA